MPSRPDGHYREDVTGRSWPTPPSGILAQSWHATIVGRVAGMLPATFSREIAMNTSESDRHYTTAPWNKGKVVGQKAPLKLKDVWAIRIQQAQRQQRPNIWRWGLTGSSAASGQRVHSFRGSFR